MRKRILCALLLLFALLLAACGAGQTDPVLPSAEPVVEAEPEPSPEPEPTPTPEPGPDPDTPAGRAAAKGLPEPPDVDIDSWEFKLVNTNNGISEYHIPVYGGIEGQGIDARIQLIAYDFLRAAQAACGRAYIAVAYRNFEFLFNMYQNLIVEWGSAVEVAARWPGPGCSEHQIGLAMDFTDDLSYNCTWNYFDNTGFEQTELYKWLHEHCAEYGFIDRYPEGKELYYGTPCTEGHFRYVGQEAAQYIMDTGICFEEFLMLYDPDRVFIPEIDLAEYHH